MCGPTAATFDVPVSARVTRSSLRIISMALVTPASPAAASAKRNDFPISAPRAPSASAFAMSWPERMPPSNSTSQRPPTASTISGRTEIVEGAPSSWRPPWLETTIASAPAATLKRASSASRTPLRINFPGQRLRTHSTSRQFADASNCVAVHSASVRIPLVPPMRPAKLPNVRRLPNSNPKAQGGQIATSRTLRRLSRGGKRRTFGNLAGRIGGTSGIRTLAEWTATQFDASANWRDVEWVRSRWPGKLILKGVLDAEDARLSVAAGADAIVVSNHGGRQLDGAPSTISVLPEIVEAVGGRCEVLFDGGIRSGQDIAKALALGARGTLIGRSFLYALAAAGEAGVTKAVDIMRNELRVTLALTGTSTIDAVGPHILRL